MKMEILDMEEISLKAQLKKRSEPISIKLFNIYEPIKLGEAYGALNYLNRDELLWLLRRLISHPPCKDEIFERIFRSRRIDDGDDDDDDNDDDDDDDDDDDLREINIINRVNPPPEQIHRIQYEMCFEHEDNDAEDDVFEFKDLGLGLEERNIIYGLTTYELTGFMQSLLCYPTATDEIIEGIRQIAINYPAQLREWYVPRRDINHPGSQDFLKSLKRHQLPSEFLVDDGITRHHLLPLKNEMGELPMPNKPISIHGPIKFASSR